MAILVSNDDGIRAPGLRALAKAVGDLDEVYVVAPDRERSAASHSLTLHRPLRIHQIGEREFAVDGTPTDAVLLAVRKILPKPPRLVLSGVNHGANLASDVTYSGTVSAALEGAILGIPAIAISLVGDEVFDFGVAAQFGRQLAAKVLEAGLPDLVYLNVNVPGDLVGFKPEKGKPVEYEMTHMGKRDYGEDIIIEKLDPRKRKYYWIGGDATGFDTMPGTDCSAVSNHCISVTPLRADITHYQFLEDLRHWKLDGFRHSPPKTR